MTLWQKKSHNGGSFCHSGLICTYALVVTLIYVLLLTASAVAGELPKDLTELNLEDLKKVQVSSASMYLQSDREAPSSVTVITADQIRKFGYRTLADILRSVRGFYISYDRNYSYVGVRGFSRPGDYNDRILLLLNGHRLTDNVYNSALIGTEFQLDVDLIERVEIVRGPSSSLYGSNAFFAVVNVITKKAVAVRGAELSAEVDGFGTYKGRSTYGETRHGVEMLFSGSVYESAGPARLFFPAFNTRATNYGIAEHMDDDAYKSYFGDLKFRDFTLEAVASTREKGIPTASFGTDFNDPRTRTVDSRGYLDLQYNHTFDHNIEFTSRAYCDRYEYHGTYVYAPQTGANQDALNEDFGRGDWFGIKNRITKPLWRKHKVTAGVDFRDNLRQDQSNYNLEPYSQFLNDQRDSKEWAVYAQDEFSISKGLIFNAGVRHDHYETFGGTTNPRLALIYSPFRKTTFKFLYGRAFRAPNDYELYYHDGVSQRANPSLQPEKIQTTELVWEQDLGANFRFTADGFDDRISGLISEQMDSDGLIFYQNSQRAHSQGLEFELAGKSESQIEGRISYTLQKTRDAATNVTLSNSPAQMAKLNLIVPMVRRNLFFGLEVQSMSSRKTVTGSELGAFGIANATISTREFAGFRLSGSFYNFLNQKYSDPVGVEIAEPSVQQNGRDFRVKITRIFRIAR